MTKPFMRDPKTGRARFKNSDENLYIHYPDTCCVNSDPVRMKPLQHPFATRPTATEIRLVPSRKGWVAVLYETKGRMTFYVQLSETRAAWQRRIWDKDFEKNWNHDLVREAVDHFLWVAECEEQKRILPRN